MSFNIGENIGPYRIIEQLGQGGMATVYKAYHAALDRYVALKVLHPAFHEDQTFIARFQREARVVARLEHPNIVPIYDYSEHEARPYLVMKYIEGDTLKARLSKGPLSSDEIEQVVNSVGSALAYAHKQGILHRDIKPSNVLIATDGVMYLADFGLARIAQAGESTLSSDSIMGTPQYISPEQAMGKKDLDEGTDLYSFGVMLYEMVVGQVPFSADTPFSIIHDHIYTPLPLPMDINPKVPEPVQRVLLKALAKDRTDRYASVNDMIKAFKGAWMEAGVPMQGTSITMRPGSLKAAQTDSKPKLVESGGKTVTAKGPKKKRSPWTWAAVGIVVCLCLAVAGIASRNNRMATANATPTSASPPIAVPTNTPPPSLPNGSLPPNGLPPTPSDASPEVSAARDLVSKNPGDPDAHLQLSLALWDSGQVRPAFEELAQAANLAGPTNKDFFTRAAQEFKKREAWSASAGMYLRLVPLYRESGMPQDLENDFHESVYKSTEQKDMPLFVFFERIDSASLPLGYIARSRYALFNGKLEEAKAQLANAEKVRPDMYEVFLLKAEIFNRERDPRKARDILVSLSSRSWRARMDPFDGRYISLENEIRRYMRIPLVAGNWKMNKTIAEARELVPKMILELREIHKVEKVICPPFTSLLAVSEMLEGSGIGLGAQNMYWEEKGAFTGEIAPAMLKELCGYVILGHSERRAYFGESNETVNRKLLAAQKHELTPIVCVGETLDEYESNRTRDVVSSQTSLSLRDVSPDIAQRMVVAYEPVWAIGTGKASTAEAANTVIKDIIRPALMKMYGEKTSQAIRVLYGGSVTASNAAEYFDQPDIDGALVGGASLKLDEFVSITKAAAH